MKKDVFKDVQFIKTATKKDQWPELFMPEIGVVGRSNVGKSSLLNDLFQRKKMVKTSSQPGKTRALNFFVVGDSLTLVDFPGYGYAKASKQEQEHWGRNIQIYLEERESLGLILFLFDIRRTPNDVDKQFLDWLILQGKKVILVITKSDKISKSKRCSSINSIKKAFEIDNFPCIAYSCIENIGRKELIFSMLEEKSWAYQKN